MTEPATHTLDVPGAVVHYDVRAGLGSPAPTLLMIGSPMDASGFVSLAEQFPDRTVVTYDPRGVERSKRTDGAVECFPDQHADDLHRIIDVLGEDPVDVFASSGGAVNALALVARHPQQVRTLVAHEPPAISTLPDRDRVQAAIMDIQNAYQKGGFGPGMARFIALISQHGELPADYAERPAPDPAAFGLPTEDSGTRDDPLLAQNLISCTHYEPDFDALRAATTRIVIGVGAQSEGELAYRTGVAVAERLGTTAVTFPSHHGGFLGGEGPMAGDPVAFAATLRTCLAEA